MNRRGRPAIQNASTVDGRIPRDVPPTIKAQEDIDGCGCLECRNIETTTVRRSVLDTLTWSVRLFRSYPSIVVFGVAIVLLNRLVEIDAIDVLPTPVVGVLGALASFAFIVLLRAYVATIVAGELTDQPVTVREGLYRSLRRTPALVSLLVLVVFAVLVIPFLLSTPLFVLVAFLSVNPVEVVGFPAVAAIAGLVFVGPILLLLFKFWFAPEACVIGRYGPVESLRVSWRLTTAYRTKFLLAVLIAAGSAISVYLPGYLPTVGTGFALNPVPPLLGAISASLGELLSVVWAGAYAHIYVQGIVD